MLGLHITLPVACFRKGLAREYLETEPIPPPSTCYGFLLSLVGETDRRRHIGARVTPMLLNHPDMSVVLRTVWRVKSKPLGSPGNTRPDYQQLMTGVELVIWLESADEQASGENLESRVRAGLDPAGRSRTNRFGGLSFGESTHLVDTVSLLTDPLRQELLAHLRQRQVKPRLYRLAEQGLLGLPTWVDHVGSAGTVHVVGELVEVNDFSPPDASWMPQIRPKGG